MVDNIEVTVTDLFKKHSGKSGYEGMYSIAKHMYQDYEEIVHSGFAIDKENLLILKAKIRAILIDELPKKRHHQLLKRSGRLYVIT
jgi:ribosomal protein L36